MTESFENRRGSNLHRRGGDGGGGCRRGGGGGGIPCSSTPLLPLRKDNCE